MAGQQDFPFDDTRPFTRDDAVRAGLDPRLLRTSRYRRIFRGVRIRKSAWTKDTKIQAALHIHPQDAVATHFSAARLFGLPVPDNPFEHVTVFNPEDRRYRAQIKCHVSSVEFPVVRRRGLRASHPLKTFVDLAGWISLVDLVVLGDAISRVLDIPAATIREFCRESTDYYAGLARQAAEYVRDQVDSPMETRLRMLIVLAGLPEPSINHLIVDEYGVVRRRLDLSYPELKLIIEYDGRHHIEREEQWNNDLDRREELDDNEWKILVVTARGVYKEPGRTVDRVRRNLILRGSGPLPPINHTWISHFPV